MDIYTPHKTSPTEVIDFDRTQRVFVVDDDPSTLESIKLLLSSYNLTVDCYQNARVFLDGYDPELSGCLILDLAMPEMDGLTLQSELIAVGSNLPIIFVTGFAEVDSVVQAFKAGAFEFLEKPYDTDRLVKCIQLAMQKNKRLDKIRRRKDSIEKKIAQLTPREYQVLQFIVLGRQNKSIAFELNLSQRTVEIYRSNVMHKMQTKSLAELVMMTAEFIGE